MALFTTALVPVDIFLVSYMKYSNGTFKVCHNIMLWICVISVMELHVLKQGLHMSIRIAARTALVTHIPFIT